MNQKYPSVLLENAVNELSSLPGVGRKTALRLALHMLRRDVGYTEGFASALLALRRDVKYCKVCHNICEVVLALSTTMEGDTTNFFIYRKLSSYDVKISVIARGVSIGDEIEYADEITLGRSIVNRTSFNDSIKL